MVCSWSTAAALELKSDYLKAYMRRAQAYEALEKYEEALEGTYYTIGMEKSAVVHEQPCR